MRATVERGVNQLERRETRIDGLMLVPGDSPGLTPALVATVLARFQTDPSRIVMPRVQGKRGHPLVLPWTLARQIRHLPPDTGVNALLSLHEERFDLIDVDDPGALADLDTPDDYRRWTGGARHDAH